MASAIVLEELFERGDARFVPELLRHDSPEGALARKWLADPRAWARQQLLAYIDDGADRRGHRALVKRILREAESRGDVALLAHLLRAFDRYVPLQISERYRWRVQRTVSAVVVDRRALRGVPWRSKRAAGPAHDPRWGAPLPVPTAGAVDVERFSIATRRYLQRRIVRDLRKLARKDAAQFREAVVDALALYDDAALGEAARILSCRGALELMHHGSPVLRRMPHKLAVAPGRALAELTPAPLHGRVWRGSGAAGDDEKSEAGDDNAINGALLRLLTSAQALLVRRWAAALLQREHADDGRAGAERHVHARALVAVAPALFASPHGDVQLVALELLARARGIERLSAASWLALLDAAGAHTAPAIVALVEQKLTRDALSVDELARLAKAKAAPVALLAARWLIEKSPVFDALAPALDAPVDGARALIAERAGALVVESEGTAAQVRDLIDAAYADVRARGLRILTDVERYRDDAALWGALAESPFSDVRALFLRHLAERAPALPHDSLARLFATTLLSIHGGGRGKRVALLRLAEHAIAHPDDAATALPLLGVALRSTREPEARAALAALARAALRQPQLRQQIGAHFPELELALPPPGSSEVHA